MSVLKRIKKVRIQHFRGFTAASAEEIDTDANIILVLGPNGTGKTSFMEALQLVLTGVPISRGHDESKNGWAALLALQPNLASTGEKAPSEKPRWPKFEISADVIHGKDGDIRTMASRIEVSGQRDDEAIMITHTSSTVPYPPKVSDKVDGPTNETPDAVRPASDGPALALRYSASSLPSDVQLQARLTSFFQHDVARTFDDAAQGRTVLDLAAPVPARVRSLVEALKRVGEILDKWQTDEAKAPPEVGEADRARLEDYAEKWAELIEFLHDVAPAPVAIPNGKDATAFAAAVAQVVQFWTRTQDDFYKDLPLQLQGIIDRKTDEWRKRLEDEAPAATDAQRASQQARWEDAKRRMEAIQRRRPRIEAEATAFRGAFVPDTKEARGDTDSAKFKGERLLGLPFVLDALRHGLDAWIAETGDGLGPRAKDLHRELTAIRKDALGAFATELGEWTQALKNDVAELNRCQNELAQATPTRPPETERLKRFHALIEEARSVPAAEWSRLMRREQWDAQAQSRQRRAGIMDQLKTDLDECASMVEWEGRYDPAILGQLRNALVEVLSRFKTAGNPDVLLTVKEEPSVHDQRTLLSARALPGFLDGRRLADLSSGQHAQMAVACVVAQNLLVAQGQPPLDRGMPHRVLLLDDVSGTYDLTNLLRETLLWRQLAYADETCSPLKRQLFISSHHEDLSNQLIDHLVPPEGCEMRVLRFTDWSLEKGPTIEAFRVEPTQPHYDAQAREACRHSIEALFYGT